MKFRKYMLAASAAALFGIQVEANRLDITDSQKDALFIAAQALSFRENDFDGVLRGAENRESWAQYQLGVIYEKWAEINRTRPTDTDAIAWYRRAAEQGHEDAAAALRRLGV